MNFEAEARAREMKRLRGQVRAQLMKVSEQYKIKANKNHTYLKFQSGDLMWLHLRKERFPSRRKNKLMVRGDGP